MSKSIEQYERESFINESTKGIKVAIKFIIGILIFLVAMASYTICSSFYRINIYAGHISVIVVISLIVYFFIYPIYKLINKTYFILDYDDKNIKKINAHNDKVIVTMAKNIINFSENTKDEKWYNDDLVEELKTNLNSRNIEGLRENMTEIINTSIRDRSNDLIIKWAIKTGVLTAISQSDAIDSLFVIIINLLLVKDLVFLYGFRYSAFRFLKTFIGVFVSSATAYGLQNANLGHSLLSVASSVLGRFVKTSSSPITIPISLVTSAANVVTDSSIQGIGNALMTAFIGYQTIGYLDKEYRLQEILYKDEKHKIDLLDEQYEFDDTVKSIEKGMKEELKKQRNKDKDTKIS